MLKSVKSETFYRPSLKKNELFTCFERAALNCEMFSWLFDCQFSTRDDAIFIAPTLNKRLVEEVENERGHHHQTQKATSSSCVIQSKERTLNLQCKQRYVPTCTLHNEQQCAVCDITMRSSRSSTKEAIDSFLRERRADTAARRKGKIK